MRAADTAARLRSVVPAELLVLVAAFVARAAVIFRGAGLHGSFGYDAPVYFASADALIHGRMPYSDFVFLHPPGIMLALTPFAALTHVVSDGTALGIASLAFAGVGAVNAVLVVRIGRRLGLGRGAVIGGLFYALWFGSIGSEYLTKLEPLGNLLFLGGVLLLLRARAAPGGRRLDVLGGALLGAAVTVKIWWVVPVALVLVWVARARVGRWRPLTGAAVAATVVCAPFFLASPRLMWRSVVSDQLARSRGRTSLLVRVDDLTTVPRVITLHGAGAARLLAVAALIVTLLLARRAVALPVGRAVVALTAAQLVVVLAAPPWFTYYCDYLAAPFALLVAAAVAAPRRRAGLRVGVAELAVAVAACLSIGVLATRSWVVPQFAGAARLAGAVSHVRCVMSDAPMAQIELDALSRGLADGCPNWIDVTGRTYSDDSAGATPRIHNAKWQRDLVRYLRSGDAFIVVRGSTSGLTPALMRSITRDGTIARAGRHVVYRVDRHARSGSLLP